MSLAMTVQEREAYLADVHVAIVSVADDSGWAPLAVPIGTTTGPARRSA